MHACVRLRSKNLHATQCCNIMCVPKPRSSTMDPMKPLEQHNLVFSLAILLYRTDPSCRCALRSMCETPKTPTSGCSQIHSGCCLLAGDAYSLLAALVQKQLIELGLMQTPLYTPVPTSSTLHPQLGQKSPLAPKSRTPSPNPKTKP